MNIPKVFQLDALIYTGLKTTLIIVFVIDKQLVYFLSANLKPFFKFGVAIHLEVGVYHTDLKVLIFQIQFILRVDTRIHNNVLINRIVDFGYVADNMIHNVFRILDIFDTRQLYIPILEYLDIRDILVVKLINHRNLIVKPILLHRVLLALPAFLRIHAFRRIRPIFHKLNPYNPLVASFGNILNHFDIVKQYSKIYIDVVANVCVASDCRDSIRRKEN